MTHTVVIKNGLKREIFVDASITASDTLLVAVAHAHFPKGHIVSPGGCLRLAATPHLTRCLRDGRLQFQLDNRSTTPMAFVPQEDAAPDTLAYAVVDESALAGSATTA